MRTVCSILTISCLLLAVHAMGFTARADGDDSDGGPKADDAQPVAPKPPQDAPPQDAPPQDAPPQARTAKAARQVALRLEALELQVAYLSDRELALTQYVLGNEVRANGLDTLAASMRKLGYENRKIPVDSRVALLKGLEGMATSMREDLPILTDEQTAMLKKLRALKAKAAAAQGR